MSSPASPLQTTRLITASHGDGRLEFQKKFDEIVSGRRVTYAVNYHLLERLGSGSQGVVFLADRVGAHGFSCRVAIKLFSPAAYLSVRAYLEHMIYISNMAARLVALQQDHLLDIVNFVEFGGIQVMVMEWVDGFDLQTLLDPESLSQTRNQISADRWEYINDVVVTPGPDQLRLKPGVAVNVLRECLAGLAALHRENIVHGDIKPANLMIKRTGNCKIIDFGSAFDRFDPPDHRTWTPHYAPVEALTDKLYTRRSDLASLGYVLLEALSGRRLFSGLKDTAALIERKKLLYREPDSYLPDDTARNDLLIKLIRDMIQPDPSQRFPTAEAVDLSRHGAFEFHRQLIKGDLSSNYETDIRWWLDALDSSTPAVDAATE